MVSHEALCGDKLPGFEGPSVRQASLPSNFHSDRINRRRQHFSNLLRNLLKVPTHAPLNTVAGWPSRAPPWDACQPPVPGLAPRDTELTGTELTGSRLSPPTWQPANPSSSSKMGDALTHSVLQLKSLQEASRGERHALT